MIRRSPIFLLCGLAIGGCASTPAAPTAGAGSNPCVIVPSGEAPDTVVIGLPHPISPSLFDRPGHGGAGMLSAVLQETLVETDCHGRPLPALALRWSADASRRTWSFTLRPDAVFTDGTPLDARAVAAAWSEPGERRPATRTARARVQNVAVTGRHDLTVQLDGPADVTFFADPSLGIRRYVDSWPVGTGPYEIVHPGSRWSDGEELIELRLSAAAASSMPGLPRTLLFHGLDSSEDLRTALDLGMDVLAIRETAALDYARTLGGYQFTKLPWDLTHYLVAPAATASVPVPDSVRASLARDAVPAEAMAAPPLAIEEVAGGTALSRPRQRPTRSSLRVVYAEDDDIGRSLAERIVALAARPDRAPWLAARLPRGVLTAEALPAAEFKHAVTAGMDAGYIIALTEEDRRANAEESLGRIGDGPPLAVLTPLVQTRATLVHRPWLGPMRIDAGGTLRFGLPRERGER